MNSKRVIIATLLGLVFGLVCYGFAASGNSPVSMSLALSIITGRTLIGFAIGISCLKMGHWSIHGLVQGLLFSIPMAFGAMLAPENPEMPHAHLFTATVVMGMIYGFLIELITTKVFKA